MTLENGSPDGSISVYTAGQALPDLGEFNLCIPPWGIAHAFAWWARLRTSLPPAAHTLGSVLPVLAHEAARRGYRLGQLRERPALQVALVGASGTAKSTSLRLVREFYRDFLRQWQGTSFTDPWIMLEGSIPGILEQLALRHSVALDQTNACLFHEEFTAVLESKDRVAETLNQLFDGETFTRYLRAYAQMEQKGEIAPREVRNPTISALVATTYNGIETATTKRQASGGFYSRLMWFTGAARHATLDENPLEQERMTAMGVWHRWGQHLDALEFSGEPRVLDLHPDCKKLFEGMLAEVNEALRLRPEDNLNAMRLRGLKQAKVVACLWAFSQGRRFATEDDAARALLLVRHTFGMTEGLAERWSPIVNSANADVHIALAQTPLLDAIAKAGTAGLKKSELYRVIPSKTQLDLALQTLVDKDLVEECKVTRSGRGRPGFIYRLVQQTPVNGAGSGGGGGQVIPFPQGGGVAN